MIDINIKSTRKFSLTQENVMDICAHYLNETQGTNLKGSDLSIRIQDSDSGDFYGPSTPARIVEISATADI